ncbi:glutathione synthetase [Mesonia sp. K7]|uniref:glutathione synthetase n=1 Tax=Mesonia sp. K7 TaxID=2218606 RepID=UPI000DA86C51|nr:glutathione synthetase [Mesonia sp. K7]PZD77410.1 glutathione synthase [Mesonia sp. K7]
MRICFVLNNVREENYNTSVVLMHTAHKRGHTVFMMDVGDFNFTHDEPLSIHAIQTPKSIKTKSAKKFIEDVKKANLKKKKISAKNIDVLFIRNNPTEEIERQWAEHAGVAFGKMMQQEGVLVLNDAYALSHAFIDKLYFEELPSSIKPDSIITRKKEDILDFFKKQNKKMVLKPLEGSGGKDVYLIDENEKNLNQIIETLLNQGYVIAQEFLPDVKDGDVRIILMNGQVIERDGKYSMIRRKMGKGEFRSNFKQGATAKAVEMNKDFQKIIEVVAPKLINDGLFFVGLDVVKDKLIEINVLSPGGLDYFNEIDYPDFGDEVIDAIERKIAYKEMHGNHLSNKFLATMA